MFYIFHTGITAYSDRVEKGQDILYTINDSLQINNLRKRGEERWSFLNMFLM